MGVGEVSTHNSGTATISAGDTSVTVDHELTTTPAHISVTPQEAEGIDCYVDTVGATSFAINITAAQLVDTNFYWRAET